MSKIQFRLAARTDAAGKFNATAPLEGNEDNMFIDADLSNVEQGMFMADQIVDLTDKGCLMVVADGMGGMNAGEVASAIAIKTVMEYFDAEHMAAKSFRDSRSRMNYMEEVVVAADAAIKADSHTNKEHEGMGSTIIMAWLCDNEICLTWCGDSRAYLFRPGCGFWQVSKDHSYVQGLVDDGKITPDEAFDHPYGNIITRSLGDPEKKAKADSINFEVYKGDIFMLCSDGLSGVLRDHKTYMDGQRIETENLEDIIAAHRTSMAECRDELFAAAERNDWYDNVTSILCEIVKGTPMSSDMKPPVQAAYQPRSEQLNYTPQAPNPIQANNMRGSRISIRKKSLPIFIVIALVLLGGIGFLSWKLFSQSENEKNEKELYDKCKTANQYRIFLADHPNSKYAKYAKSALDDMIRDSIKQARSSDVQEEPISKHTGKTEGKDNDKTKKENEMGEKAKEKEKSVSEVITNVVLNPSSSELTLSPSSSELTPSPNNIPKEPLKNKPQSGSTTPKTEEEAYQRTQSPNATFEDCCVYIEKTNNKGVHVTDVRNKFRQICGLEFNKCKTYEDYQAFLDNHIKYVTRMRLDGSDKYDTPWRTRANKKMEELRPKPGVHSQTSPKH